MQRLPFFVLLLGVLSVANAQSNGNGNGGNSAATASADQQWQSVRNKGEPNTALNSADSSARGQAVASYVADADALKDFYTKNPTNAEAKEAKRREALALLYARTLGDASQKGRCKQLVQDLRKDATIDVDLREQVAAFSDNLDVEDRGLTQNAARLLAYEQTARALQTEFPASPSIYESLNAIAFASADDRAATVASDLLHMPGAPDRQKAQAQILLSRLALKGTSLLTIANAALGADNAIQRATGKPLVVYSWSSSTPQNLATLKALAAKAPPGTAFVGVCVDLGDLTAARSRAASDQPPGEQLYDSLGFAGKFAGRVQLTTPGLIYLADRTGVVVSVSAQHDATALLSTLSNL